MAVSTSRWEWRTFGDAFGEAELRICACAPDALGSRETYVLAEDSNVSAKIRDGLLEVKSLIETDAQGLERWTRVLQAGFPLDRETLAALFHLWNLRAPAFTKLAYALPEFLTTLVAREPRLTAVDVKKTSRGGVMDGCRVELANLTIDGVARRTVGVDMSDAARVWTTVRALGLSGLENVNYVRALKRLSTTHTR